MPAFIEQAKRVMDIQMIVQGLGFKLSGGKYPLSLTECLKASDRDKINGAAAGSISRVLKKHLLGISIDNSFCSARDLIEAVRDEIGPKIAELKVYQECNGEGIIEPALPLMIAFVIVRDHHDVEHYPVMMTARKAILKAREIGGRFHQALGHLEKEAKKKGEHLNAKELKDALPNILSASNVRLIDGDDHRELLELVQMMAGDGNLRAQLLVIKLAAPDYHQELLAKIDIQRSIPQVTGGDVMAIS
jgi:hypothetical protein